MPAAGSIRFCRARTSTLVAWSPAELQALRRLAVQMIFQDPYAIAEPPHDASRDIVAEPLRNLGIARGAPAATTAFVRRRSWSRCRVE